MRIRDRLAKALAIRSYGSTTYYQDLIKMGEMGMEAANKSCNNCGHSEAVHGIKEPICGVYHCPCMFYVSAKALADAVNKSIDAVVERSDEEPDMVNHPSHYNVHGPEVIELVRWLSFNRGSAVKYIARAGHKDPSKEAEDIEKAIFYLTDELKIIRGEVQ